MPRAVSVFDYAEAYLTLLLAVKLKELFFAVGSLKRSMGANACVPNSV